MKNKTSIVFIVFLLMKGCIAFGQNDSDSYKIHKCDSGYSYFPCISTTSLSFEKSCGCLPDSIVEKQSLMFRENMCGETGFGMIEMGGDGSLSYTSGNHWNDSTKACEYHPLWQQKRKGKWVSISKEEYEKILAKRNKNQ